MAPIGFAVAFGQLDPGQLDPTVRADATLAARRLRGS